MKNPENVHFSPTTPAAELNRIIRSGHPHAWEALDILSRLAQSGDKGICHLLNQIDQDVQLGLIKMPPYPESEVDSVNVDQAFFLTHPILALRTKIKQVMVSLDHELPPHTSNIEDFPNLPLYEAYVTMVRGGQLPPPSIDWYPNGPLALRKSPQLGDRPEHHND